MTTTPAPLDQVEHFAQWWLNNNPGPPRIPFDLGLTFFDATVGVTLFRQAPFQVQMFICRPHLEIPDHIHPNVDSVELYAGGEGLFRNCGEVLVASEALLEPRPDGLPLPWGMRVRVRPNNPHGATVGAKGFAFLSIQQWLNGLPPTSVERDWAGPSLGGEHEMSITTDAPVSARAAP